MSEFPQKKIVSNLKFVYSDNGTLSVIFQNNDLLLGVAGEFNNNLKQLEKIKSIGTFLKTPNGFKVTAPEGFVAINTKGGAVKLVDRLEFSHANFTIAKDW